jgi:hypothetical protein
MKIRIIPDIHGHDWWKNLIEDIEELDYCIFLGDYVDDWTIPTPDIISNLQDIIEFKRSYMHKVVLLYGNHEWNYLNPYIGYCSGFRYGAFPEIEKLLIENKNLFQICKLINISLPLYSFPTQKLLFSHAGFSKDWIKDNYYWLNEEDYNSIDEDKWNKFKDFKLEDLEEKVNFGVDSHTILDRVMQIGYTRGGVSPCGGPLWADFQEMFNKYIVGFRQFVGHTPMRDLATKTSIYKEKHPETSSVTFCDCGSREIKITLASTDKNLILVSNDQNTILC